MILKADLPPAYELVVLNTVDSTNDEAKRRAEAGAQHGTLIWAQSQVKGRGRRGNQWVSPTGNLYMSLVLRPDCPVAEALQLSFVASLALADALGDLLPAMAKITCKWPNDVFLNGRKVAGLLLESATTSGAALDWLVLGVGVNVANAPADLADQATSLHGEGAGEVTPAQVLEGFSRHFLIRVEQWCDDGFRPLREAWLRRAEGKDGKVTVRLENETFSGRFVDIDQSGALVVEMADSGRRVVTAGDVFMGAAA
ncbi:MAG: biotin--[acetyl-CoA-carboxylase] ligase [Alphaproteobacteria bacterium]